MDYCKVVTVPKNTTKKIPEISQAIYPKGIIKQIGYQFPEGCKGLAHFTIWFAGIQMWPRSVNVSYYGDKLFRQFPENFQLPEAYNILTFKCWNEDDTWPHTITIHITILKDDEPGWIKKLFFGLGGSGKL